MELDYAPPAGLARATNLLTHPALVDRCLRSRRVPVIGALRELIARHEIDVCLVSDRALLFAVPALVRDLPVVIDWTDSFVLHGLRNPLWRGVAAGGHLAQPAGPHDPLRAGALLHAAGKRQPRGLAGRQALPRRDHPDARTRRGCC